MIHYKMDKMLRPFTLCDLKAQNRIRNHTLDKCTVLLEMYLVTFVIRSMSKFWIRSEEVI